MTIGSQSDKVKSDFGSDGSVVFSIMWRELVLRWHDFVKTERKMLYRVMIDVQVKLQMS